ncbi:unnamed protein product [Rotaria sordida]|uniref:Cation/H+ exchanger transmembrane domain-containing protein n=1 Tax=Rotaria sordida TaxID=392033 RepID=A0A814A7Z6_9BILA|nr:unnamed protein product [Rotaria sordida]CAF3805062.1 unnamed protein product [Rotaria sordida]
MTHIIERKSPYDELSKTKKRGLGPEFICPFIVLFFATILRKLLRHYHISLPYTVILMLVGAVLGGFYQYELIKRFTFIADLTPVQILSIFLPILIFESAFSCDPHIFIKCLGQILILAILGFFISVALTTLAVMYWYENEYTIDVQTCWTWDQAVLYSAVVSATDPVSVVSLLKSMTSLKTLSTIIEGESLLNDAAAITIYTLVKNLIYEAFKSDKNLLQQTRATLLGINAERCANAIRFLIKRKITAIYLLKFVLKTIAIAVIIGYVMAHITLFTLYRIEAGEYETCITITMSYFVYLTCEAVEASGVIGVVLLGLTLNMNRSCFSVSAIHISKQTWELLAYISNSLIFITVGVILLKTYSESHKMLSLLSSIPQLLLIYIILILVRGIMILSIHSILKHIAYGFTWKDSIVTIWSGLRGGVSLVLALTLFNSKIKDQYQAEIMLIHTTAIVFLTCTVNALTIPNIVHILRLDQISELIKQTMIQIIKELKIKQNEMIRHLKKNPILATADWLFVQKVIDIQSPFNEKKEESIKESLFSRRHIDQIKCDHCQAHVTIPISKFEFKQTFEDCRVRILRLQKTHFWLNYYNGQLSSYGLHTLNSLCDRAMDTPKKLIDLKTIKAHIIGKSRLRSLLNIIRNFTRKWQKYLPWYYSKDQHKINNNNNNNQSQISIQQSQHWYKILFRKLFHCLPICLFIMFIECIIIIYQLHTNLCNRLLNQTRIKLHLTLEIISSILLFFDYIQLYYWFYQNKQRIFHILILIWIILYPFTITCRFLSSIIYLIIFIIGTSKNLCITFYILKSLSLIECIILCLFLIEPLQLFVDYMLNQYVSISYDIGLAYISSEEQALKIIHRLTDNEIIRIRLRELSLQHIKNVLNDVLIMQENHPGTVISIKTHHTLNLLYNTVKQGITQIRSRGVLDNDDCNLLEQSLKNMHVYLHIPSTMTPASPIITIHNLAWIFSNEQLTIQQRYEIEEKLLRALPNENIKRFANESLLHPQTFSWQDFLWHKNDKIHGIYLLVNGIIEEWKLDPYDIDAYHYEIRCSKEFNRTKQVALTTPQISSSIHLKHVHYSSEYHQSISKNRQDLKHSLVKEIDKNKSNQNYESISIQNENIEQSLRSSMNEVFSDALSREESISSRETDSLIEVQSINTLQKDTKLINTNTTSNSKPTDYDHLKSTTGVRVAFEDGFYMRWHHLITIPMNDKFKDNLTIVDDDIHQYYYHTQSEENFDEFFNETFDKYRQMHPATSERIHRRYSYSSGDCIGLYDFLISNGEKYESTAKCLTNVTVFFISKEKLFEILNTYSLWDALWLEIGIQLALRILPDIRAFQHSLIKSNNNCPIADFTLINKRLLNSGLLIYNEMTCTSDDVIHIYEDLLLIAGSVRNQITKCVYESPIFIKRSLSKQGLKLLEGRSITKILVLPKATTTINMNNLFTNSSLIHHILDVEMKRDFSQRSNDVEQFKKNQMKILEYNKCNDRTCLKNTIDEPCQINDDNRYPQTTINIDKSLLVTDNNRF